MHVESVYVCECTCIPQLHVIVFRVKYTPQTCLIILSKSPLGCMKGTFIRFQEIMVFTDRSESTPRTHK